MARNRSVVKTLVLACALPAAGCSGEGGTTAREQAVLQAEQERRLQEDMRTPRPIEALESVWLEELTWMEVRDLMATGTRTIIVATGGLEQNGPYLATGKHNYVLHGACEGIALALGDALCAPIVKLVPEGDTDPPTGHMRYPSTIGLRESTFRAVLDDVASSLKAHGFEHIVFIGDSGGNQAGMEAVAAELEARWAGEAHAHYIPEFYRYADVFTWMRDELGLEEPMNEGIHDDFVISSIMLAHDPTTVRYEQRVKAGRASINGLPLEPLEEAQEIGRKLLRYRVDTTVEAIRAALAGTR